MKDANVEKWTNRRDYHENIKPHIALIVREKLLEIDWDILSHLLCFPDLVLSDYYLFLLLKNSFRDKWLQSVSDKKREMFFANKPQQF